MTYIDSILTVIRKFVYPLLIPVMIFGGLQASTTVRAADVHVLDGKQGITLQEPSNAEALSIINRPNRLTEEHGAWNPVPIPLEEFLHPKIPLKERYPTTDVDLPSGWGIGGLARWMDNRYLLITLSNPDMRPGKQKGISSRESREPINERIYVLDSDTGSTYFLKIGRLQCYWANQIVYITGTRDGQNSNSPYKNEIYKWIGPLTHETRYPFWESEKNTTKHSEFTCMKTDVWEGKNIDAEKFKLTNRLFPEHGYLAMEKKFYEAIFPPAEYAIGMPNFKNHNPSKVKGLLWYKPNGTHIFYPDVNFFDEVGSVDHYAWAPFLNRYVFSQGRSVTTDYRNYPDKPFKTVTLFSPTDGSIHKIVHKRELDLLKTNSHVLATRAGLLWGVPYRVDAARQTVETGVVGIRAGPGLFLSQGEKFKQLSDIGGALVSPDGCRIFRTENKVGSLGKALGVRGLLGAFIINLCKEN